jgi:hypothetical protein
MAAKLITCHFNLMPVIMKNRFSIIKRTRSMMNLEKDLSLKGHLVGQRNFGLHQNTITSHISRPPHNIACSAMGMHGNGLLMHPGYSWNGSRLLQWHMIETFILIHNYEASLELILFKNSW